jgi:predicted nucleotide-binding protein (sugar kinase/HSP70/actin superfamily)
MYEAEYRLALRNSGFEGFRVLLFQQSGGLSQSDAEAGLEMNLDFFLGILNAMNFGDVLNDVAYQIRPFEVREGATDDTLSRVVDHMRGVLRTSGGILGRLQGQRRICRKVRQSNFGGPLHVSAACLPRYVQRD